MLSFVLLLFLCGITVKSQTSFVNTTVAPASTIYNRPTTVTTQAPAFLQLVATPHYPVAEGQRVHLHCDTSAMSDSITWFRQPLNNHTWEQFGTGRDLTLTRPEDSGTYVCRDVKRESHNHTVYIISMHATVTEKLGVAAFVLSLLNLLFTCLILFWLGWQRFGATLTTSSPTAKSFPVLEKASKGGLPQTEVEGETYMNYTTQDNTSQSYAGLDLTSMTEDAEYSSLS